MTQKYVFKWIDGDSKPQTFEGFRRYTKACEWIAIVFEDGGKIVWELQNNKEAVEELERFYRMSTGNHITPIIYRLAI